MHDDDVALRSTESDRWGVTFLIALLPQNKSCCAFQIHPIQDVSLHFKRSLVIGEEKVCYKVGIAGKYADAIVTAGRKIEEW